MFKAKIKRRGKNITDIHRKQYISTLTFCINNFHNTAEKRAIKTLNPFVPDTLKKVIIIKSFLEKS